jgi:diguanylate cyclase (GGDEF)-like protein/PAS domain S-box-containing protein
MACRIADAIPMPSLPHVGKVMLKDRPRRNHNGHKLSFTAQVVQQLVVPTFVLDTEGHVLIWNKACEALTGMPASQVIGTRNHWRAFYDSKRPCLADLIVEDRLDEIDRYYTISHPSIDVEYGLHTENWCVMPLRGKQLYLEIDAGPIHDQAGNLVAVVETLRDMTLRQSAESRLRTMFDSSPDPVWIIKEGRFIECNDAAIQALRYASKDALLNLHPAQLSPPRQPDGEDSYSKAERMMALTRDKGLHRFEWVHNRADGSNFTAEVTLSMIDSAGHEAIYCTWRDISDRKRAEEHITHLAHHDVLTGLFNRYSLEDRFAQSTRAARRENRQMALIFIDLDRFKVINDTLGHSVGDLLLIEVANRLSTCVRESDIVARLGGDEFVVALTSLAHDLDAAHVAQKIIAALGVPCVIEGKQLHTTPSLGISLFPENGEDVDELMKNADTAMYHAKGKGRNNFQFFSPAMTAAATERLELERDLRSALNNREFELHYQPQVSAAGLVCGVEALIRWRHPERGLIPPLTFITIAEESGVIEAIGSWVLEEACRQMAEWRMAGFDLKHVAVNLSAVQLRSHDLVSQVQRVIARFGLAPGELELEITESVAMEDPERAIGQLRALRDSGVELAIDDFGTGYSSLAYLKMLPIHTLKLDRVFVHDIETDENDAAISSATLALAKVLGLRVVAEGVETEAQRDFLARHGCHLLQGYLFGKPEPADVLTARWQTSATMPRIA